MSFLVLRRRQDRLTVLFPLLAVGFFAALTYWLDARVAADATQRSKPTMSSPDHFMEQFTIERTSVAGRVDQVVVGVRATHYPSNNTTVIEAPKYQSNVDGKAPLNVQASKGIMFNDPKKKGVEQADFSGKVIAMQGAFNGRDPIRYESESLTVFPQTQRATTKDTTRTVSGDRVVTTQGIEIDAENQTGKTTQGFTLELNPKENK
ncbi:MAG: LPS export ABC transporter periplasmic protein LptC [Casimicrobium sp.]